MANIQTILRGVEPVKSFETYFDLLRAETPETLREVFRLRYRVYCLERRFENPADHPNGQETDQFDRRSLHSLLVYQRTGAMTGTVRLVLPELGGAADHIPHSPGTVRLIMPIDGADPALPIQQVCSELAVWPQDLLPAATTAEISRFAVSKDFRRRIGESQFAFADTHVSERRAEIAGGVSQTAWASRTQDGMDEWLELEYAKEVELAAVIIHETYNPGAVYKITAYSKTKMEAELWKGKDPTDTGAARGVSEIKIKQRFKTKRIRIHINSTKVKGWNEIDAVGIKDSKGNVQWAIHARASSSYASNDQPDNGLQIANRKPDKAAKLKAEIEKMRQLEAVFLQQVRALEAQLKAIQQQRIVREKELKALEAKQ